MRYFLTTDTHFGHTRLKQGLLDTKRPDDYERLILWNLKATVEKEDTIIHLGDVAFTESKKWHELFTNSIPGRKILVLGNHDQHSVSWHYDRGWDFICSSFILRYKSQNILFSHIPQKKTDYWDINVHGHFHNTTHRSQEPAIQALYTPQHRLLSLEWSNYRPVPLDRFLDPNFNPEKPL